jgi:hypothetical protein
VIFCGRAARTAGAERLHTACCHDSLRREVPRKSRVVFVTSVGRGPQEIFIEALDFRGTFSERLVLGKLGRNESSASPFYVPDGAGGPQSFHMKIRKARLLRYVLSETILSTGCFFHETRWRLGRVTV